VQRETNWFETVETVIREPLCFKSKLDIGEDTYKSLRLKSSLRDITDVAFPAAIGAGTASLPAVASTFFAPSGFLALLGFGAAVTPIGWVIAAGVLTGGVGYSVSRYSKKFNEELLTVIPKFINTPMDVLAIGLFDLLSPLALKVAEIDGEIHEKERLYIASYFTNEWGYDESFVSEGLSYMESNLAEFDIEKLAQVLASFKKANPDCNYESMSKEIVGFLIKIIEADGMIHEHEEKAIENVEKIFIETKQSVFKKKIS